MLPEVSGPALLTPKARMALVWSLIAPLGVLAFSLFYPASELPSHTDTEKARTLVEPGATFQRLAWLQSSFPERWPQGRHHRTAPPALAEALEGLSVGDVRVDETEHLYLNVHGTIPGVRSDCAVLIAAHHDAVPGAPGAIDDGGAVAVLLETAKILAQGPPPPCDIDLAFFDAEEQGLLGAKAYVAGLDAAAYERIRAMLALELLGWRGDRLVVHTLPAGFAWEAPGITPAWVPRAVIDAGDRVEVPVGYGDPYLSLLYQAIVRELALGTGSDAGAFLEAGIPSAMLAGSSLTRFYSAYHTTGDTLAQVSSARLDDATRVTVAASLQLSHLASGEPSPTLGEAYLYVYGRWLDARHLMAWGLSCAGVLFLALVLMLRARRFDVAAVLLIPMGALIGLSLTHHVLGLLTGTPLGLAIALSLVPVRRRWPVLVVGALPLAVTAGVMMMAALAFGATWHGPWSGAVALLCLPFSAPLVARVFARTHRSGLPLHRPQPIVDATFRHAESPMLPATRRMSMRDTEPCVESRFRGRLWYHGTGVTPAEHPAHGTGPLTRFLDESHCSACRSTDVQVRALVWGVELHTGYFSFDFELQCSQCDRFTAVSYREEE